MIGYLAQRGDRPLLMGRFKSMLGFAWNKKDKPAPKLG